MPVLAPLIRPTTTEKREDVQLFLRARTGAARKDLLAQEPDSRASLDRMNR